VGITACTASANRAYAIAKLYRDKGIPVVIGGIHASMCTEEALQHADTVVIGEAETIWPEVLADFKAGRLKKIYRGGFADLKSMPPPRRDLFNPKYLFASIQTSRGCPMDCDFCSVTAFNGHRYRRRPVEDVLEELKTIPDKMMFFVDDNIVGYSRESRDQVLELFKGMVKLKINKWWFCQASLNFADDEELLLWAGRAGCKMVFLGLEAEEADALVEVNKRLNVKRGVGFYADAFRRIQRAGIAVLGAFIFGMDNDTVEKLQHRADYMMESGINVMQSTLLTPLPGTRLFKQYNREKRLIHATQPHNWDHYDMTEVVYRPCCMTSDVLNMKFDSLNAQLYAWPVLARKAIRSLLQTRNLVATMFSLQSNLNYRAVTKSLRKTREKQREEILCHPISQV